MRTSNLQELQIAPDYELDHLLAEGIGYTKDQIKLVPVLETHGGKECQVYHDGAWKRFSHRDPSVAFPLSVKHGFIPFNIRSLQPNASGEVSPVYQVFTIRGGPLYSRITFGERVHTFINQDPYRALAIALIFYTKGGH